MKRGRPKGRSSDTRSYGPLGDLIRKHRLNLGMGLLEVADACGCSVQFISNIEHGRAPLPWEKAEQLAKALDITIEELHAANLAIRSDFKSFMTTSSSESGSGRKKVAKAETALAGLKDAASLVALTARDRELREILQQYSSASAGAKKRFQQTAKKALGA